MAWMEPSMKATVPSLGPIQEVMGDKDQGGTNQSMGEKWMKFGFWMPPYGNSSHKSIKIIPSLIRFLVRLSSPIKPFESNQMFHQ